MVVALSLLSAPSRAHAPNQAPHQLYKIGDFKLESGEVIKDFSISYVTHGKLNAKKSNAILMVTAISGNHHRLDFMIGPGKALDTDKYFIVCTDAIGNGLTTSPSNSTAQPRMQFPKFQIRDMVASQHRLMTEHLGISRVVAVVGPSMGGMQALQWGVSHPGFMDSLVAMVPLAKTPAWSVAVMEASRKAIMLDPAWKGGNYTSRRRSGIRLWRDILGFLAARTPEVYRDQFPNPARRAAMAAAGGRSLIKVFDANDWIYQTWAYDRHDVGTTPGFNGDTARPCRRSRRRRSSSPAANSICTTRSRRHRRRQRTSRTRNLLRILRAGPRGREPSEQKRGCGVHEPRRARVPRRRHRKWAQAAVTLDRPSERPQVNFFNKREKPFDDVKLS